MLKCASELSCGVQLVENQKRTFILHVGCMLYALLLYLFLLYDWSFTILILTQSGTNIKFWRFSNFFVEYQGNCTHYCTQKFAHLSNIFLRYLSFFFFSLVCFYISSENFIFLRLFKIVFTNAFTLFSPKKRW